MHVDSSPRGERSISRALTKEFVSSWLHHYPGDTITYQDVGRYPVPPIDEPWIVAAFNKSADLPPDLAEVLRISDQLISELLEADLYLFGVPMYNFSIPANFKAYIDQVVRVNRTFTPDMKGLLNQKKAVVITTRGSSYAEGTDLAGLDFQAPLVTTILGFVGVTDVTFIHAENLTEGEALRQKSLANARRIIQQIVTTGW